MRADTRAEREFATKTAEEEWLMLGNDVIGDSKSIEEVWFLLGVVMGVSRPDGRHILPGNSETNVG